MCRTFIIGTSPDPEANEDEPAKEEFSGMAKGYAFGPKGHRTKFKDSMHPQDHRTEPQKKSGNDLAHFFL
jgi:hypothetical protein